MYKISNRDMEVVRRILAEAAKGSGGTIAEQNTRRLALLLGRKFQQKKAINNGNQRIH